MTVTDEQIEQAFEQAYAAVVTTSPVPLDWDEATAPPLQLSQPPRVRRLHHPLAVFVTVAAVILAGVAAVVLTRPTSTVLEAGESDQWRAIVFLTQDVTEDVADSLAAQLQDVDGVSNWIYVDQQMALDEALVLFQNDERQTAIFLEDPYIIPASIRFATTGEASARAVVRLAADLANNGETAIDFGIVGRGKLVATGPEDLVDPEPVQGDFVTTTLEPGPP